MLVVRSSGRVVVATSVVVLVIDIVSLTKEAMIVLVGVVDIREYNESSEPTADPPLSAESTADLDPPLSAACMCACILFELIKTYKATSKFN